MDQAYSVLMEVSSNLESVNPCDNDNVISSSDDLLNILESSTLPELSLNCNNPYETDIFKDYVAKIQSNISKSIVLLSTLKCSQNERVKEDVVISTVVLCGEHYERNSWTNTETICASNLLLKELLNKCKCRTLPELLLQYSCEVFIFRLRVKLDKTSWKKFPAAVTCFKWILTNIKCPHLGELLCNVLPICLVLVDDHEYINKTNGLYCLQHVAANVSRTELNQYGIGAVIYKAVEHMIYLRDPEIIRPLASCLVVLLSATEHQPNNVTLTWNHFDDVLNIWLPCMEMEQQMVLQEAYIDSIDPLLAAMGLSSVRWSRKLLNILSEYSKQGSTEIKALKCLQTFVHATWPRVSSNFQSIILILMKVVLRGGLENKQVLILVKDCLRSLETLCKPHYNKFLSEVRDKCEMSSLYSVLTVD